MTLLRSRDKRFTDIENNMLINGAYTHHVIQKKDKVPNELIEHIYKALQITYLFLKTFDI